MGLKGIRVVSGRRKMTRAEFDAVGVKPLGYIPSPLVVGETWRCEGHTAIFSCERVESESASGIALRTYQVQFTD